MSRVLMDEVVETDYGQFDLIWFDPPHGPGGFDGEYEKFFADQVNGLVGTGSG